jgi:hypothetical protein
MAVSMANISGDIGSAVSVAGGATTWSGSAISLLSTERGQELRLFIDVTFNASASGNAILHIKRDSDTNSGTYAKTIEVSAGNTVSVEHPVLSPFQYLDIAIENEDATYSLTYSARYEGMKITGL